MNRAIEPNDDSLSQELANLEQQLKRHRPRAPRLDAAILETAKSIVPAFSESTYRYRHVSLRLVGVIAASWIFGAVVGGGGMFFSMSRSNPALSQSGVEIPKAASRPPRDESNKKTELLRPPLRTHEVAIGPTQEALNIDQLLDNEDEPLHVLTRFSLHKPRTVRNVARSTNKSSEPIDFRDINAITEPFSPTNPVTRAELMQQYLESPARKIF